MSRESAKFNEKLGTAVVKRPPRERIRNMKGKLHLAIYAPDKKLKEEREYDNVIVDAGENFLVAAWRGLATLSNMKYHGIGTGSSPTAESDTALGAELGAGYDPNNTRATGTLALGSSPNILRTVATNAVDATVAITEWGLFDQAATGGGTMWSRVVFSTVNLSSGDSVVTTYELTVE